MQKYSDVIQDRNGNVITGASVLVKTSPGAATATIYSNNTGTAATNPLTTDSDGYFEFWAANGQYTLTISKSGITTETTAAFTLSDSPADVMGFGATGDGTTDDTAAINAALLANKSVFLPPGTYVISGALACTLTGQKLIGAGPTATTITSNVAATAAITIATGLQNVEIAGFTLTRSVTATSGGDGIKCSTVSVGRAYIHDLVVEKQYNNLSLGPTDFSTVERVTSEKAINDGFYLTNTAADGAVQWSIHDCLSQKNTGRGYAIVSIAGPSQVTLGTYQNLATFANSGRGIAFIADSGVPIHGIRMKGGFIGEDGDSEVYLDTYGRNHQLNDLFIELAGSRTTGPTLATAASSTGSGIQTTANNTNVQISNCLSSANSLDGMHLSGVSHAISNPICTNNGQASSAGRRNGIFLAAGRCTVIGGICSNTGAGSSQTYGILNHDANQIAILGTDLNSNATAGYGSNASGTYITAVGNLPNTLNVGLAPQGAVLVSGAATGDWGAAGTINVGGGLLKNDTAYTNP